MSSGERERADHQSDGATVHRVTLAERRGGGHEGPESIEGR